MAHTPGPWHRQNFLHDGAKKPIVSIVGGHHHVAITDDENGNLIAAAPDLLKVCEEINDWLRQEGVVDAIGDEPEWYQGLLDAIEKARP